MSLVRLLQDHDFPVFIAPYMAAAAFLGIMGTVRDLREAAGAKLGALRIAWRVGHFAICMLLFGGLGWRKWVENHGPEVPGSETGGADG